MMILVTGGSGSGKSAYAEQLITGSRDASRYYIATMIVWDDEGRRKVEKHRRMRAAKQFQTIECQRDLQNLDLGFGKKAVLLECISNLTANELFGHADEAASITETAAQETTEEVKETAKEAAKNTTEKIADKILSGVRKLENQSDLLVIVTNDIFDDGIRYPEETREYQQLLGDINYRLASMADKVVEVVYTIPVIHKDTKEKAI